MAVHRSLHTYDKEKAFMAWLLAITEYKIVDYIRGAKKRSDFASLESIEHFCSDSSPDSDLRIDLEKAVDRLSFKEKKVFELLKFQGLSIDDVARQLNLTEANVKVIAHRAYLSIKTYLGLRQ